MIQKDLDIKYRKFNCDANDDIDICFPNHTIEEIYMFYSYKGRSVYAGK